MLFPGDITEAYRLFLLLLYLFGLFVGILQWILNMLILNLVSNLQILREIEEKSEQRRETWAEKRVLRPIK